MQWLSVRAAVCATVAVVLVARVYWLSRPALVFPDIHDVPYESPMSPAGPVVYRLGAGARVLF